VRADAREPVLARAAGRAFVATLGRATPAVRVEGPGRAATPAFGAGSTFERVLARVAGPDFDVAAECVVGAVLRRGGFVTPSLVSTLRKEVFIPAA
jgi:hypothetical protein